jgi:hypothetical protein
VAAARLGPNLDASYVEVGASMGRSLCFYLTHNWDKKGQP